MDAKLFISLITYTFIHFGQVTCYSSNYWNFSSTTTYWWRTTLNSNASAPVPSYCQNLALSYYQTTEASSTVHTPVRLIGGYNYGRVEVYHRGEWGTVCDDAFDNNDARVICRMLGFSSGHAYSDAYYGQGTGCIILDNLGCYGWENDIALCSSSGWFRHGCSHNEDAGVSCYDPFTTDFDQTTRPLMTRYPFTTSTTQTYQTTPTTHCEHLRNNWSATYSTPGYTPIQLVGGNGYSYGRVEIFHEGVWGTVCDDSFDNAEAEVICRMLGFTNGTAYTNANYGEGSGCILLDDLQCRGYETDIASCGSNGWFRHDCGHGEDASVSCYLTDVTSIPTQPSTSTSTSAHCSISSWLTTSSYTRVRLAGGNGYSYGRVEVYQAGIWGTVCDDSFDDREAYVICRMLGHSSGTAYGNAYYGQGSGCIILDDLNCNGYESNIASCGSGGWFYHNCGHSDDASVYCYNVSSSTPYTQPLTFTDTHCTSSSWVSTASYTTVRLVGGNGYSYGRVEVYYGGVWGTVCDDSFDDRDAQVICRMLGYSNGAAYSDARYGQGSGCIILDDLNCNGYESNIVSCGSGGWFIHNCGHSEDASVNCYSYSTLSTLTAALTSRTTTSAYITPSTTTRVYTPIRLANGPSSYSGRVEVFHNGQWGTICDRSFDDTDARVICRMLGFYRGDSYSKAYGRAHFGQGGGPIWLGYLTCSGNEYDIHYCGYSGWDVSYTCSHYEDVGVDCNSVSSYTLPWWFDMTTESERRTTKSGPSLTDTISVNCNEYGWNIRIDMNLLRHIYPGSKASDIYLGENTCNGVDSWNILTFQQGLRECLTSQTLRDNAVVYSNQLVYAEHDPYRPFIIRYYNWTVGVECDVQRNETSSGHIHHDSSNVNSNLVTGASHYAVNMTFYLDPNFNNQILGYPLQVPVGTDVYVKVFTTTSDWTIKMRVHTCYTKPSQSSSDQMKYYLIRNGCETDVNTHIISQSSHETRFLFQDFEYTSNHEGINVYCDAIFCQSSDYSRQCLQTCNPVVKRSVPKMSEFENNP